MQATVIARTLQEGWNQTPPPLRGTAVGSHLQGPPMVVEDATRPVQAGPGVLTDPQALFATASGAGMLVGEGVSPLRPGWAPLPPGASQVSRPTWMCSGCWGTWAASERVCPHPPCPLRRHALQVAQAEASAVAAASAGVPVPSRPSPADATAGASTQPAGPTKLQLDLRVLEAALGYKIPFDLLLDAARMGPKQLEKLLRDQPGVERMLGHFIVQKTGKQCSVARRAAVAVGLILQS